jgi:hypothetical protein
MNDLTAYPAPKRGFKHPVLTPFFLINAVIGGIALEIQNKLHHGIGNDPSTIWVVIAAICLGLAFVSLCLYFFIPISRSLDESARIIKRGVPSPIDIRLNFIQDTGREPTMEEVAAIHQMLKTEYNQALLNAGMIFGGFYVGNRLLHGKPIL